MRPLGLPFAALLLLIPLAGCIDNAVLTFPVQSPPTVESTGARDPNKVYERPHLARFDVSVRAIGSLKPGEPIQIVATVAANLSSPATEVRILAPEVEAAKLSGWDAAFRLPIGQPLPAAGRWNRHLTADERFRGVAHLTIPTSGYYRVVVTASHPEDQLYEVDGRAVVSFIQKEIWLWIDESGGGITDVFDGSMFAGNDWLKEPGPLRRKRSAGARRTMSASRSVSPQPASASTASTWSAIRYQMGYLNKETNTFDPLRESVYYQYNVINVYSGNVVGGGSGYTDSNGFFEVRCGDWLWEEYDGAITLKNGEVLVTEGAGYGFGGDFFDCGPYGPTEQPTYSTGVHPEGARLLINTSIAARNAKSLFGRPRGRVTVDIDTRFSASWYDKFYDEINISDPNLAWGTDGVRVTAHEYGHAYHQKALGGMPDYINADCSFWGGHAFTSFEDPRCAYNEGFAHYLAAVTRGTAIGQRYHDIANFVNTGGSDGARIEAYVAAFLFDMTDNDGGAEYFDQVSVPVSYVGDIMKNCKRDGSAELRGIGHWIYCAEGWVDPNVLSNPKFFTDLEKPSYMSAPPTMADWQSIRRLWTKVLYNEG